MLVFFTGRKLTYLKKTNSMPKVHDQTEKNLKKFESQILKTNYAQQVRRIWNKKIFLFSFFTGSYRGLNF